MTRTSDLQTVKTRAITFQNADNTFPPSGSVLAAQDSRGHLTPTRSLSLDSIALKNDSLVMDSSGNIVANTLALLNRANAGVALVTEGGNIVANNANIVATGSGTITGQLQGNVVNLADPTASNPDTYLYANSGSLLWQNPSLPNDLTVNLSQAALNMSVDPSGTNLVPPANQTDLSGIYHSLTTLLNIFNQRQIFISYTDNSGSTPPVNYLPPYSAIFNSKCGVLIRVVDALGIPANGVGDFVFYGNANNGSVQYSLTNLCTALTNLVNVEGNALADYVTFTYNSSSNPLQVRVAPTRPVIDAGYYIALLDIDRVGEAQRFMNHLGFHDISSIPFGPLPVFFPPTKGGNPLYYPVTSMHTNQYLPYIFNGAIVGHQMIAGYKYPNNDVPLLSPSDVDLTTPQATSIVITINPPHVDVSGLQPSTVQQLGNELRYFGVYLNGTPIWIIDATLPLPITQTVTFENSFLQTPKNIITITSIDCFNETLKPDQFEFSLSG